MYLTIFFSVKWRNPGAVTLRDEVGDEVHVLLVRRASVMRT